MVHEPLLARSNLVRLLVLVGAWYASLHAVQRVDHPLLRRHVHLPDEVGAVDAGTFKLVDLMVYERDEGAHLEREGGREGGC